MTSGSEMGQIFAQFINSFGQKLDLTHLKIFQAQHLMPLGHLTSMTMRTPMIVGWFRVDIMAELALTHDGDHYFRGQHGLG